MTVTVANVNAPRALVVDDSKLARATLSKMLRDEKLEVDTAESAEAALEYLSSTKPDVVFLDQNMPGMNGLDALKAIKANPATATIPVMMYTSESAGVYLSQARALGAFDVLVKEDLKATDIHRPLQELRLRPFKPAAPKTLHVVSEKIIDEEPLEAADEPFSSDQQRHLQRMIREEQAYWNRERDEREVRLQLDETAAEKPADFQPGPIPAPTRQYSRLWPLAFILLGTGLLTWLIGTSQKNFQTEPELIAEETLRSQPLQQPVETVAVQDTAVVEENIQVDALLSALEWALSQRMEYPFDEQPLAGDRLSQLQTMLTYLVDAEFKGEVQLLVRHGNFCLVDTAEGGPTLPAANTLYSNCKVSEQGEPITSDLQSVEFALFVNSSPLANGDRGIRVVTGAATDSKPLVGYPAVTDQLTAGEWNTIAARNNHVAVRLLAE